jgi:P-loop Domain of unknown function (DUF2791)
MEHQRTLTGPLARALIRSLNRGTAVREGARFIHVGQQEWVDAQLEMLGEVVEDGNAETKFVRGSYGAGKSHFLSVIQDLARERNWATSHVECKTDSVEIDRFETLYPKIAEKLAFPDLLPVGGTIERTANDPITHLMVRWSKRVLKTAGIRDDALSRPFDADERVYGYFERHLLRSNLPTHFVHAALAFCRACLQFDQQMITAICAWMKGNLDPLRIPAVYLKSPKKEQNGGRETVIRPVGKGTAHDAMRSLLWLIRDSGYAGLVLCIDEVEELARLGTQKRQDQALQSLREFVDHAGGGGGYVSLCMYLAATPEMFESEKYFPRYDALATRIQPFGSGINWRGPVIDLEKKPLSRDEMTSVARAIAHVYMTAYGPVVSESTIDEIVPKVVESVMASRQRLAKPRLLARVLVDELERARREGAEFHPTDDMSQAATRAAMDVLEAEKV